MRHQDPRTTTELYGHLASHYLKREIERLSFGPPPGESAMSPPHVPQETRISLVAGGAKEPPIPAGTRADAPSAAPFSTRCYPAPKRAAHRRPVAEPLERIRADLRWSGRQDSNLRHSAPKPMTPPSQVVRTVRKQRR